MFRQVLVVLIAVLLIYWIFQLAQLVGPPAALVLVAIIANAVL